MLEERALGDADEALTTEPGQAEEVVENVVHASLVESAAVDQTREIHACDDERGLVVLDGRVEESEEEWIEDPAWFLR